MNDQNRCPGCGDNRPLDAPAGLCPGCLLRAGMVGDGSKIPDLTITFGPASSSVLARFGEAFGKIPTVLLRDVDSAANPSPVIRPSSPEIPDLAERSARLQLFGEIARGGMGAVLKGRDSDLGRDLAVKVLLESHRDKPEMVRRFIEEAQIAGQLQHPGIVPIYELGAFGDQRPFFSMKLVKGHTLAETLAARKSPTEGLPRLLSIFESICQTMAYAHARGVIHRDLKPSNVMVGSFGEVQVMDWGLAKVLPRGGAIDDAFAGKIEVQETVIATARSISDSDLSQAGSVMGTPSYMAPEQARGEIDQIDERADVFALGSIFCEILTGQSAFIGRTSGEILRKAALGDLADALARLESSGVDPELITLAKDCLSREPEVRPKDAGAVADRVAAYLAGVQARLRKAEISSVEERGRRRLTMAVAAAVLLFGLSGSGGYLWIQHQKAERQAKTARAVDEALTDASRLRGEAQAAPPGETTRWAEALSAAKRAEGLLSQGEAEAPLRSRVAELMAQLIGERDAAAEKARQIEADHALLAELETVRGILGQDLDPKRSDAEYAAAFRKAGLDIDKLEPAESRKWLRSRTEPMELASYLDDWAYVRIDAKRPEANWRRLLDASRTIDPDPWRDALRAKIGGKGDETAAEFRRLADDHKALDAQPAAGLILLARQLRNVFNDRDRAARVLRRAVFRHPGEFWVHFELSRVHGSDAGQTSELFPQPEESVLHLTAAVAIRPGSSVAHQMLGVALEAQEKMDEAVAQYREAIRINPNYAWAHNDLGVRLVQQGKFDEGIAEFREAIRLKPFHNIDILHANLGSSLVQQGKVEEGMAELREALRLKPDKADAHDGLGQAFYQKGQIDEAIAEYRLAIRDYKIKNPSLHNNLGRALYAQGKYDEAVAQYREALRIKPDYANPHNNLGIDLQRQGKYDEAIAQYREALRIKPDYPNAHSNLGVALSAMGKYDEAIAQYREALRIKPDNAPAHINLGEVLRKQGDFAGSLAMYRKGHELGTRQPDWRQPSAKWLEEAERLAALAERLPAILKGKAEPKDNADLLALAQMCYDTRRFAAAARFWAEGVEMDPRLGQDPQNFHLYNAACSASLTVDGKDVDNPPLDDSAKAKLCGLALGWLKADLAAWAKLLESGRAEDRTAATKQLQHWKIDPDLAPVRDAEALAKLPEAERQDWQAFWAEVDALIARASKP